ncbi:peptidoglycan D,D-transpeptidase FtsI family protein [Anaerococcus sp. ENR0831]|uniref:Peptidoglycan D,D-transpeptidase FtsI family protein n=1 Tax=Anaerococcus martiniensis TaxID=3115615 RepID=A0ABW9M8A0_9FIRM
MSENNNRKANKKRTSNESFLDKIKRKEENQRLKNSRELKVLSKSTLNKRLLFVMIFFVLLFMGLALYLVYFQLFKAKSIASNDNNRRNWINEDTIARGKILDRNDNVLAYSDYDQNGNQYRHYNYGKASSTVTGYNSKTYGKTGIEKTFNKWLLNLKDENMSNFRKMVVTNDVGNDLHLTIDQNIQNLTYNYMSDHVGAAVVMNPKTGEILAMVSNPTFDPNNIDANWDNLIANNNGPLVNRTTTGLYRPGSTFKIVTANAMLESNIDENYEDTGSELIQNFEIKNFDGLTFGNLDLRKAFMYSSNTYFAAKTNEMGKETLANMTDRYMFNKTYPFDLEKYDSIIPYKELNQVDLAMTGFGYGKSQVTPLHMAMVTSTIANDGVMMQPRLVKTITDKEGKELYEAKEEKLSIVTSQRRANNIRDMMVDVVNEGTGKAAYIDGIQVAGKTGTTDKSNGFIDAWFVGFAPAYDPQIAIAIVVEDAADTGGVTVAPIARNLMRDIFNQVRLD